MKGPMNIKPKRKAQPVRQPKPIVYAKCRRTRTGRGSRIQDIFMTTFTDAQWAEGPQCPNCNEPMVEVRRGLMPV